MKHFRRYAPGFTDLPLAGVAQNGGEDHPIKRAQPGGGFALRLGLALLRRPPLALHPRACRLVVTTSELRDFTGDGQQCLPLGGGIFLRPHRFPQGLRQRHRQWGGQDFPKWQFARVLGEFPALFHEEAHGGARLLVCLPIHKAALPPRAQVLLTDERAAELGLQHRLHLGELVKPRQQRSSRLPIGQPPVQRLADALRQPRDFAKPGFHGQLLTILAANAAVVERAFGLGLEQVLKDFRRDMGMVINPPGVELDGQRAAVVANRADHC